MYVARMVISAMVVVIPVLICLAVLYLALMIIAFRKGRDELNRRIGWRFLWMSILTAVVLGVPGLVLGILFGFLYQGESITYDALAMTPENVLLTGCIGMELGWLAALLLSFVVTTRRKTSVAQVDISMPEAVSIPQPEDVFPEQDT